MKSTKKVTADVKASSVRITPAQYDKFHRLAVATNSSINRWVQRAADQFIEDEWQARMDAAEKLEKSLRS